MKASLTSPWLLAPSLVGAPPVRRHPQGGLEEKGSLALGHDLGEAPMSDQKDMLAGILDVTVGNPQPPQGAPHERVVIDEQRP